MFLHLEKKRFDRRLPFVPTAQGAWNPTGCLFLSLNVWTELDRYRSKKEKKKKKNSLAGPISGSVEDNCRSDNSCSPMVTVPSESEQFKAFQRQIVIDTQRPWNTWMC